MAHNEYLLQYVWKHKLYDLTNLTTTDGESIEVIDTGMQNTNAGPDFLNAKIKIGDKTWAGNVEIHRASTDWQKHGHHTDKAYNSVILHAAELINTQIRNEKGLLIPQFKLSIPAHIQKNADFLLQTHFEFPCRAHFSRMEKSHLNAWLDALAVERMERKTKDIYAHLQRFNNSWDETLYVLLSRNFGFGLNSDEFERLALSIPLAYIRKHADDVFTIEALLFGQAGMLEDDTCIDTYFIRLKKEYAFLQRKYMLKPLNGFLFKSLRVRPSAFPQVRIAQLAALLHGADRLFSLILEKEDYKQLRLHFMADTSPYWDTHYSFGKASPKKKKHVGDASLNILLINTIAPILFAYGKQTDSEKYCDRAMRILASVPAERNAIITRFKEAKVMPQHAFDSQALIQLKKEYCDKKKCLYCKICHSFLLKPSDGMAI